MPRFRFAPSPTGIPHIGNLHTALFSWALARAMDGDFILRIEDTDTERNSPQATQQILDALTWLGLDWDEGPDVGGDYGPYIQSQRSHFHQKVIQQLLAGDHAYYGDDPTHPGLPGENPLRLRMPRTGETILPDALRGDIRFDNRLIQEDPVLVRADGRSLYHLAAMADDHEMGITHVVRGDDWISTSPIHLQLYNVMGWQPPVWIHLPLILNKRGEKLKKRDPEGGYLVTDFQEVGYLPEAVFNYLLLLGWAPDNAQEILNKWQVRQQFRLERLGTSPSVFDWDKLNWVNRQYLQKINNAALAELVRPFLEDVYDELPLSPEWLVRLTAVIRDGLTKLADAVELSEWAFVDKVRVTENGRKALSLPSAHPVLVRLIAEIAVVVLLDEQTAYIILQNLRHSFHHSHAWSVQEVLQPVRAALTGQTSGPPLHQIMGILGKERVLQRIGAVLH